MSGQRLTAKNIPELYTGEEAAVLLTLQKIFDFIVGADDSRRIYVRPVSEDRQWEPGYGLDAVQDLG